MKRALSTFMVSLTIVGAFVSALTIKPVIGWTGTVYIRADGSIDPSDAPLITYDYVTYTLTSDITSSGDGIVVERDSIIVDGTGHTLHGPRFNGYGIIVALRSNVGIRNLNIKEFSSGIVVSASTNTSISGNTIANCTDGIILYGSFNNTISANHLSAHSNYGIKLDGYSSNNAVSSNNITACGSIGILLYVYSDSNTISGNHVANCSAGIELIGSSNNMISENTITNNLGIYLDGFSTGEYSSNNTIVGNTITAGNYGILLDARSHNSAITGNHIVGNNNGIYIYRSGSGAISENNITDNSVRGIYIVESSGNTISENNIKNNLYGVELQDAPANQIFHNNFLNNAFQALAFDSPTSTWDDGYPAGGNYWSDYTGVDAYSGPNQDQPGSDSIGDTSYLFDYSQDRYPFMTRIPLPPAHDVAVHAITLSKTVVGHGYPLNITVTVGNQGSFTEAVNLILYADVIPIHMSNLTLPVGTSATTTVSLNTSELAKGNYTITAAITAVPEEVDIVDNALVDGWIMVTVPGDVDGDHDVDIFDIVRMVGDYGKPPPPLNDPNCDIDGDGDVDIFDIVIAAGNYGDSW
jgi:parallel beta-helix repeat protein